MKPLKYSFNRGSKVSLWKKKIPSLPWVNIIPSFILQAFHLQISLSAHPYFLKRNMASNPTKSLQWPCKWHNGEWRNDFENALQKAISVIPFNVHQMTQLRGRPANLKCSPFSPSSPLKPICSKMSLTTGFCTVYLNSVDHHKERTYAVRRWSSSRYLCGGIERLFYKLRNEQ